MHLPFLTLAIMALTATTTAIPTDLETDSVNALARCDENRHAWQGGGCEWSWGSDCADRCKNRGGRENCCANTIGSYTDDGNCIEGWETCECYCNQKI
ncbi:hypothetical protein B0T16DRAFT_495195 [Cercophora newfieldiana]|uniref:Uncharacterized protein n=1 Tax=Cercophora newfieldiana TaxID=92897 RepID=A0AA39Y1M3_9PEZI|nr:hypothetical protein B0T16DRAFT_495195 [Cercophora newfieldiana]